MIWIITNPRTGSTYLCDLLNASNCLREYNHKNLVLHTGPLQRGLSISEWTRAYKTVDDLISNPPHGIKIMRHQFEDFFKQGQRNKKFIDGLSQDTKYIKLKRKNVFEHATSIYMTRITKVWHVYDDVNWEKYLSIPIPIDYRIMYQSYVEAVNYQSNWDEFDGYEVFYEDIMENTDEVLQRILEYCGFENVNCKEIVEKVNKNKRTRRVTRPESQRISDIIETISSTKLWV